MAVLLTRNCPFSFTRFIDVYPSLLSRQIKILLAKYIKKTQIVNKMFFPTELHFMCGGYVMRITPTQSPASHSDFDLLFPVVVLAGNVDM